MESGNEHRTGYGWRDERVRPDGPRGHSAHHDPTIRTASSPGRSRGRTLGDTASSRRVEQMPTTRQPAVPAARRAARNDARDLATHVAPQMSMPLHRPRGSGWSGLWRALWTGFAVVATVVVVFTVGAVQAMRSGSSSKSAHDQTQASSNHGVPQPSGRMPPGPWVTIAGVAPVVLAPPPPTPAPTQPASPPASQSSASSPYAGAGSSTVEPCHDTTMWIANISQWSAPPGCYGNVYVINAADYPARPDWGYCNWWVEQTHLYNPTITVGGQHYLGASPAPGDAVFFAGGVQGASSEGHWAEIVAIAPDGYWMLISEMNFAWRGAGFGKVDYRYVHAGSGLSYYG